MQAVLPVRRRALAKGAGPVLAALLLAAMPAGAENPDVGDGGVPDFYDWREAVPDKGGVVVAMEPLPAEFAVPNAGKALRILYTARDGISDAGVVVVSAAVFFPDGKPTAQGWPVMAWAHGTTGSADTCAPSARARSARDSGYIGAWLDAGFAVVASDYQGLGTPGIHPYSNYRAASYSLLDSAQAMIGDPRFNAANSVILVGQSQGAGAVVAAAGYAVGHAPDLNILGVVATGAPNLSRQAIESGLASSASDVMVTAAYAMIGYELSRTHAVLDAREIFTDEGADLADLVGKACLPELMLAASERELDPSKAFRPGMLKRLWDTDVELRSFPTLKLTQPVFFGIGTADTAALPMTTLTLVNDLCSAGSTVTARLYKDQDHSGVVGAATADAIAFAMGLIEGDAVPVTCQP